MKKVVVLLIIAIVFIGSCKITKEEEITDSEKFAIEYSVSNTNPVKYASFEKILQILKDGSGILFFANSDCEVCETNAKIFLEALADIDTVDVYYYNPQKIINEDSESYKELKNLLDERIEEFDDNLELPAVFVVRNGKVVAYSNDLSLSDESEEDYLTTKSKKNLKEKYVNLIKKYKESEYVNY